MFDSAFFKPGNVLHYLKWTLFSLTAGILAGGAATVFLVLLKLATDVREGQRWLLFLLPVGGFLIGWVYHHFGDGSQGGNNLILDEIHDPKRVLPLRMAPLVLLGTLGTHLFGGSAGREGTAVQMGATLSDQIARFFRVEPEERRILLAAGAGAGFGAAIGAPWAGVIFGMEVIHVGRLRFFAIIECLIASQAGYFVTKLLHAPHTGYAVPGVPDLSFQSILTSLIAGICFGLASVTFIRSTHFIEKLQKRFVKYPPLRPLVGGLVLVGLYFLEGSFRFTGLGLPVIEEALHMASRFTDPFFKTIFTALTIGSGFKGGEFIPLVFIGTTLGSALSVFLPASAGFLGALGFGAVFAAASNTPIACILMVTEIFGARFVPFAVVAVYAAYYASFNHTIYSSQRFHKTKFLRLREIAYAFGELPRRFMKDGN